MPIRHRRFGGTPQAALGGHIRDHAREWVEEWLRVVQKDEGTPHYHAYPKPEELIRDAEALYHYLALWLNTAQWDSRIDPHYERIGRCRRAAGIPLSEVIRATILAKRSLWDGVSRDRKLSTQLELEASKAIGMFYDRAIYYTVVGYESGDSNST